MTFDELFTAYYTQYRAEAVTPSSTDEEYTVAMRFMNDAIERWANYDNVYWKELFANVADAADGDKTVTAGTTIYDCPTDFKEAGGSVRLRDASSNNVLKNIPIIEPQEAQFKNDLSNFVYFTGNPADGYKLNFNVAPDTTGQVLDYVYYKKPSKFSSGSDTTEMSIPEFMIYHALAHRFRASRNWSAYQITKRDAEDSLRTMQLDNNSGTWANPWRVPDRGKGIFGA